MIQLSLTKNKIKLNYKQLHEEVRNGYFNVLDKPGHFFSKLIGWLKLQIDQNMHYHI